MVLPTDKDRNWIARIQSILTNDRAHSDEMETVVGRNNHLGYILPASRYFLNRLRWMQKRCEKFGPQKLRISEREELNFWISFIQNSSSKGVSVNNITYVRPFVTIWTDASPFGFGFYEIFGNCWLFQIPPELIGVF